MKIELLDWRGNPITEGCTIVYPVTYGSTLYVREAVVQEIIDTGKTDYNGEQLLMLRVQPTADTSYGTLTNNQKIVSLHSLSRVTVVT